MIKPNEADFPQPQIVSVRHSLTRQTNKFRGKKSPKAATIGYPNNYHLLLN